MIKLYSWNVNGIRAVVRKELWEPFLQAEQPDIVALQEIKAKTDQIEDVPIDGYDAFWYPAEKPGYSGTGILSKIAPLQVVDGFPQGIVKQHGVQGDTYGDPNKEGRVLAAEFEKFWLVTVYTPNAKDDLSRIPMRKIWDPAFLAYLKELEKSKPVVFCGDLNVAHTEDDLANPKPNIGKKGFTDEERGGFQAFVDAGFVDTLRLFKEGNGYYTWWSHFARARERNVGWRIDYFMVSAALKDKVAAADIHPDIMGSDHCPISVTLDL